MPRALAELTVGIALGTVQASIGYMDKGLMRLILLL